VREFWLRAALNSGIVVAGVTSLSLLLAIPSAWLVERTDIPGAALLRRLFTLPYALPSYLLAIAWVLLANPRVGWLNLFARWLLGIEELLDIYHLGGVIFIEASVLFTILFLSFGAGLRQLDPSLEEAARLSGASPFEVFRHITAPLLGRHITAGVVSIALASLASFGVPAIIGTPGRKFVLTTAIYSKLQEGSEVAFREALVIAIEMSVITLALVLLAGRLGGGELRMIGGRAAAPARVELGGWRRPLAAGLWSVWGLLVCLPLTTLVVSSFCAEPGVLRLSNFSLRAWRYVLFSLDEFHRALWNSLLAAGAAALFVALLSLLLSIARWRGQTQNRPRLRRFGSAAEHAALFCYSLPGTVLAIGLIVLLGRLPVINGLGILVIAYVVKYATLGLQTVRPSVFLVAPALIEAAQLAGAGFAQRLRRIWLPMLRGPLFASALLIFLPCFSELTMSIMLYGPGSETLGVMLFNLQEYADRSSAAVVGTLLLGVILTLRAASRRFEDGT